MRYGIDMDGVIYDFEAALREWIEQTTGRPAHTMPDSESWEFWRDQWGLTFEEFYAHCNESVDAGHMFRKGDPEPGALEQIHRLTNDGHTVLFVTARMFGNRSQENTTEWLHEHGFPYDEIHFTSDKHLIELDWLVDDLPDNYFAVDSGGNNGVFLLTRPWNAHVRGVRRVESLKHFVDITYKLSSFRRPVDA